MSHETALIVITGLTCGICYNPWIGGWFAVHMVARKFLGSRPVAVLILAEVGVYVLYSIASSLMSI